VCVLQKRIPLTQGMHGYVCVFWSRMFQSMQKRVPLTQRTHEYVCVCVCVCESMCVYAYMCVLLMYDVRND
jgi:hypothetical protein